MKDDYIAKELDKNDLEIIQEYKDKGKLHPDWLPITTYRMVQSGYPVPNHGAMVADGWGGTDAEGRLLPSRGMWCKTEDVKKFIPSSDKKYSKSDIIGLLKELNEAIIRPDDYKSKRDIINNYLAAIDSKN